MNMQLKNEFSLQGTVTSFDERPMKRLLLLETDGYGDFIHKIPLYVPVSCSFPPGKGVEAGDNVLVSGHIVDILVGKTRVPRLLADEITRE
jgi:hypothetical protein